MWRGVWWSCRSPCRCQLTLSLKDYGSYQDRWHGLLLWPCDISVTVFLAFPLCIPALPGRSGSHPRIEGLRCIRGFKSLHILIRTVSGFIHSFDLSGSVAVFSLWFDPTSVTFFTCNCPGSCGMPDINPAQVLVLSS